MPTLPALLVVSFVAAPPEQVFDCARDVGLHVRSAGRTRERVVEGRTEGLLEPGEQITWEAHHLGCRRRMTVRITGFERPRWFREGGDRTMAAQVEFDLERAIFAMVANRVLAPRSKRGIMSWLETVAWAGEGPPELHHLYRSLDLLADAKEDLELRLHHRIRDLFHQRLDARAREIAALCRQPAVDARARVFGRNDQAATVGGADCH